MNLAASTDSHRLAHWVHWSLLAGVILSGLLLLVGLGLTPAQGRQVPQGPPPAFGDVVRDAFGGDGAAITRLGLILLMATPVARVIVLIVGWVAEREFRFALVALAVLGLLSLGVLLGVQ
jgi:hypothetical protein